MDKDISIDTTNLQSIEMSSGLVKNNKFIISKDKLNVNTNPTINLQIDEMKNNNSRTFSTTNSPKPNQVSNVLLYGIPIVSLYIEGLERLCLAQISNTLLKQFSYNEIHNRRVALGITCVQCTPVQLEILRRAGAMPVSSRRCGMITRREAERLCKSFLGDNSPPRLPDDFAFQVHHECAWGCRGSFLPSRYNSSRAKCIKCFYCGLFFSPNKFIFHSHRIGPGDKYIQPDAANFNSWRRHMKISGTPNEDIIYAWEDVKAMFNGGTRKRIMEASSENMLDHKLEKYNSNKRVKDLVPTIPTEKPSSSANYKPVISPKENSKATETSPRAIIPVPSVSSFNVNGLNSNTSQTLPFSRNFVMDYMWNAHQNKQNLHVSSNYSSLPFIKNNREGDISIYPSNLATVSSNLKVFYNNSAFKPVIHNAAANEQLKEDKCENDSDDDVDIETTEDDDFLLKPKCIDQTCESFCNSSESKDTEKSNNMYNDDYESNASSPIEIENSPIWDKGQDDLDLAIKKEEKPMTHKGSPILMTSSIHNEYMTAKNIWNVARLSNEYNQKTIFYNRYNHMMFNSAKIVGNNYEQNTI